MTFWPLFLISVFICISIAHICSVFECAGLRWCVLDRTPPPESFWTCCPSGSFTGKTPSSHHATNSPSASLRCSPGKVWVCRPLKMSQFKNKKNYIYNHHCHFRKSLILSFYKILLHLLTVQWRCTSCTNWFLSINTFLLLHVLVQITNLLLVSVFICQAHRQVRCPVRARPDLLASAVEASHLAEAVAAFPAPQVQEETVSQGQLDPVVLHPSQVSRTSQRRSLSHVPPNLVLKPGTAGMALGQRHPSSPWLEAVAPSSQAGHLAMPPSPPSALAASPWPPSPPTRRTV